MPKFSAYVNLENLGNKSIMFILISKKIIEFKKKKLLLLL